MKEKKEELNSSKEIKQKKTICGLTIPELIIFVVLSIISMKVAFVYLMIVSTISIFKAIYNERKEYINELMKTTQDIKEENKE